MSSGRDETKTQSKSVLKFCKRKILASVILPKQVIDTLLYVLIYV